MTWFWGLLAVGVVLAGIAGCWVARRDIAAGRIIEPGDDEDG